jgi:hypothetical protein
MKPNRGDAGGKDRWSRASTLDTDDCLCDTLPAFPPGRVEQIVMSGREHEALMRARIHVDEEAYPPHRGDSNMVGGIVRPRLSEVLDYSEKAAVGMGRTRAVLDHHPLVSCATRNS